MPQDPNIVEIIKSPYQVVHVANDQGEIINALGGDTSGAGATPEQIQTAIEAAANLGNILTKLEQIRAHVDGIEPTIGNLTISSDSINLNTDQIETKLDAVNTTLEAIEAQTARSTGSIVNDSIDAGGAAQSLGAANPDALFAEFQNQSSADLWINEGAAAGVDAGFRIPAGGYWYSEPHHKPTGTFSVFGATTGQKFAFRRG